MADWDVALQGDGGGCDGSSGAGGGAEAAGRSARAGTPRRGGEASAPLPAVPLEVRASGRSTPVLAPAPRLSAGAVQSAVAAGVVHSPAAGTRRQQSGKAARSSSSPLPPSAATIAATAAVPVPGAGAADAGERALKRRRLIASPAAAASAAGTAMVAGPPPGAATFPSVLDAMLGKTMPPVPVAVDPLQEATPAAAGAVGGSVRRGLRWQMEQQLQREARQA